MKANQLHGQFRGRGEVRLVRILPGPIERVWTYLVDPEKRARWFAGGPMEPRQGGKVTLTFLHSNIAPDETPPEEYKKHHCVGHEMTGLITRWEPPRVLGFTFGSDGESEVTFELTPEGETVRLVVTHVARAGDLPFITEFSSGWHTHLAQLIAQLENAPRPPFWPMLVQLKVEYTQMLAQVSET